MMLFLMLYIGNGIFAVDAAEGEDRVAICPLEELLRTNNISRK